MTNNLILLEEIVAEVEHETENLFTETALNEPAYLNNGAFKSQLYPKLQTDWDSTSLKAFKKCPRYYELSIVEGYTWPGQNSHFIFGIIFHKADEIYHLERANGLDHNAALTIALRYALIASWDSTNKAPWLSDEPTKTRKTLLRTIIWYFDHFQNQTLETLVLENGKAAVELSFKIILAELAEGNPDTFLTPDKIEYLLCGHLDRVAIDENDSIVIPDKKTTKYALDDQYFLQYSPDIQMTVYTIAGMVMFHKPVSEVLIDAIQTLVNGCRFRREPIFRTDGHIDEFLTDLQFLLRQAESYAAANYWPMNEESCGWGFNQCRFRKLICSADPAARNDRLNAYFSRKSWDPSKPR